MDFPPLTPGRGQRRSSDLERATTPYSPAAIGSRPTAISDEKELTLKPNVCEKCSSAVSHPTIIEDPGFSSSLKHYPELKLSRKERFKRWRRSRLVWGGLLLGFIVIILVIALPLSLSPGPPFGLMVAGGSIALDRGDASREIDLFFHHASGQIRKATYDGFKWTGYVDLTRA